MRLLIGAICLAFAATGAYAQDKEKDKKAPSAAQKKQQTRMKECNERAADKKGDERKKFMSSCLKGGGEGPSKAQKAQQSRMKDCNKQAGDKNLKGDDRKKFMSSCLKG
ncbi:MAG: PsiF family protein [Burkholderiales bacterium]